MGVLFDESLPPVLTFKRLNCEETVVTDELSVIQSLCKLLEVFCTKQNGIHKNFLDHMEDHCKLWFLFWLVLT